MFEIELVTKNSSTKQFDAAILPQKKEIGTR